MMGATVTVHGGGDEPGMYGASEERAGAGDGKVRRHGSGGGDEGTRSGRQVPRGLPVSRGGAVWTPERSTGSLLKYDC